MVELHVNGVEDSYLLLSRTVVYAGWSSSAWHCTRAHRPEFDCDHCIPSCCKFGHKSADILIEPSLASVSKMVLVGMQ